MKNKQNKALKVIIISDGTGETATALSKATMTQFPDCEVFFTRYKNVRSKEQIEAIVTEASLHHDLVVHTIVQNEAREYITKITLEKKVRSLDLIGPALTAFSNYFNKKPTSEPGLLHAVDDDYFSKVAAMEFTLNHDDGKHLESINLADVILVGISRTSKTPLSVYLSQHGIKVVNVPIILGTQVPKELFKVDQRKIFALTIDPDALSQIRKQRLNHLGADLYVGDYADEKKILEEIEWANNLFKENKRWPVFNVTNKALEETAADILKLIAMRRSNTSKQNDN